MKLKHLLALLFLAGIVACKSRSAFDYSESIVKIERSLITNITSSDDRIDRYLKESNFDSAAYVSGQMEDLVQGKLKEVESLKAPKVKEVDQFRQAAIRYFSYIKNMYTAYKNYASQKTEQDRETERQKLLKLLGEKDRVVQDMQRSQRRYAEANGFRINNGK